MNSTKYDVVIIGSGLGGLLCAVMLGKEGRKVCVLEKNRQIGGCLQTFSLRKKVFDACVHYIGGLGDGHMLHRTFSYAGILDSLRLQSLDRRGYDRILFGDEKEEYPLSAGEHFIERLLPYFPQEEQALREYLRLIEDTAARFPLYHLRSVSALDKGEIMGRELMDTLRGITKNERLAEVLAGNNMLYAGVEGQTPFFVHAMTTDGYLHSVHKVLPGSSQIAKALWRELQKAGGIIHRNAAVTRLSEEGGRIAFAQTADGRRWYADYFISAVHPSVLFQLTDGKALRPAIRQRVQSLKLTPPVVMVNLVLKPRLIAYEPHNTYWHPSGKSIATSSPDGTISWPDTQAFFWGEDGTNPGYADTLSILAYADAADYAAWSATENITGIREDRDDDYEKQKAVVADALLAKTFTRFPYLRDAIAAKSVATPLTFRDYTGTPGGSLYGALKDAANPLRTMLSVRTKIPNLLLTGQNVNMHGAVGVAITAIATCAELLGLDYLLGRIRGT